ncbi:polyubiquitin-tagged protein recognition complex, Npl4 component [Rhizopus microsporus var. microsporus]|uniref:Nuclear protein localization protein 4 n=1 Tax=Rhizopus microsporus var. microsporus TaxID=86635 RepID=A0A1X0QTM1_RHIZD|nr:polyubiquitin-tagged protein recognition complex, Npl4 component [Rhizopus microsporus var. microsporus]
MLLRIRSKEGMHRVQVDNDETFGTLAQKIAELLHINDPSTISMGKDPNPSTAASLTQLADKTIQSANLKHGDIVYVSYAEQAQPIVNHKDTDTSSPMPRDHVKQDPVDDFLEKQRGLIHRKKDPKFCRHGGNAMCDYCMPLEPYDASYLEENKIKHMSFHAYLRQLTASQQSKNVPVLEEQDFRVKVPCSGGHAPWPEGICTKCQPSAITLQQQAYRMVDHIEFSSASIIESFLNYWRASGSQRFGYLYGRYEPYLDIPLGIKAVVEAIYEPPQQDHSDGIQLNLPWEEEEKINKVAEACGLVKVGMVFSDLIDDGTGTGKVIPKRHVNSYFLSSLECIFAAEMQKRHPNISRHSISGKFGSKFVTCVISGDTEGNIDVNAYQVSDTLAALQEAEIVEPSRNPSVMRVKDSIPHERYVPEVFYKFKNEYNVVVKQSAKPTFPVEYLLVNVTHGFPHNPSPMFNSTSTFPVENRDGLAHQSMSELAKTIDSAQNDDQLKNVLADFHLLCFIQSADILNLEEFKELCQIVTQPNGDMKRLRELNGWMTLELLLKETGKHTTTTVKASTNASSEISCRHCTFMNPSSNESCEMCGLPLSQ